MAGTKVFTNGSVLTDSDINTYLVTPDGVNRNLLINGSIACAQRSSSVASITTDGYYTADRWKVQLSSIGTWTQSVENDAPTGSGLRKSLKMLVTTADASPAAGDYGLITQIIEGQDLQRVAKGTSAAQRLTLSFWVKSNVTGTFIAELQDLDNTRFASASYTISASATWERKTIVFPADTAGNQLDNDNAGSLQVNFWMAAGSTYSGGSSLQTTWGTTTNVRAVGQTNLAASNNNYVQFTAIQLETGPTATPFEFEPFETTLRRCLRYYEKTFAYGTAPANGLSEYGGTVNGYVNGSGITIYLFHKYQVEKRVVPGTITLYNPRAGGTAGRMTNAAADDSGATSVVNSHQRGFMVQSGGSLSTNNWYVHAAADAEL